MLELVDVSKSYERGGDKGPLRVLDGISLKVEAGRSVAVVGPSGSGKSTLLNIMGGLDRPTSGRVVFDGRELAGLSENELASIRNRQVGFVFQLHHLLDQCTVLENVLIPTLAGDGHVKGEAAAQKAFELLKRVGLADWSGHRPGELSGGQLQRVAVVRALINGPKLLLADEPTGSLDGRSADGVAELLGELNREQRVALVVVTHSVKLAERMEHVLELADGRLTEAGG
jgi:ABC-type lipoprotein export system ATPase subunit